MGGSPYLRAGTALVAARILSARQGAGKRWRRRERSGHTDVHALCKAFTFPKRTIAAAGLFLVMQQLTVRED
jgi:hypothetical protein